MKLLKQIARERNIKGCYKMCKGQFIQAILDNDDVPDEHEEPTLLESKSLSRMWNIDYRWGKCGRGHY